jgi:hypothetical protein
VHERNGTIERDGGRGQVLEDVGVVEAVRVAEEGVLAGSCRKSEAGCVLRDTIDNAMVGEADVD